MNKSARYCYMAAGVIIICGILLTGVIFRFSNLRQFPSRLADIYREPQISLEVPGSREVQLNSTGAYGIYYQYNLVAAAVESGKIPPELACELESETGLKIQGVPDYEPTNRYWSKKGGGPATLIQSITIEEPGRYEFSCQYPGDYTGPDIHVTIGPNYAWELIRISLKYILALLGMCLSVTTSLVISFILLFSGLMTKKNS